MIELLVERNEHDNIVNQCSCCKSEMSFNVADCDVIETAVDQLGKEYTNHTYTNCPVCDSHVVWYDDRKYKDEY